MNKTLAAVRLILCSLALNAIFFGLIPPNTQAQKSFETTQKLSPLNSKSEEKTSSEKLSADLREGDALFRGEAIKTIVQFKSAPSEQALHILAQSEKKSLKKFSKLDTFAVKLSAQNIALLSNLTEVEFISPEREVEIFGHVSATTGVDNVLTQGSTTLDGSETGIAVLDSGIYESHKSFLDDEGRRRVVFAQDFTGEVITDDIFGHGTHVASLAAGNEQIADGAYRGTASNANILNLRVLKSNGTGRLADVLAAMDWILANRAAYNIRVVNLSLGMPAVDSYLDDPLCRAARRLVDAGIVVVAAAGNNGKDALGRKIYGLVHSPGNEPSVITVGASNTFGTDSRNDDGVATYSSRGPTRSFRTDAGGVKRFDNIIKPDLVAPGNRLISANAERNSLVAGNPQLNANVSISDSRNMMFLSGTSMAAPVVAGAAALLLQANPRLTPNMVKAILQYTAQPLAGFTEFEQGAGQLNIEGAVRLAKLVRTDLPVNPTLGTRLLTATAMPNPTTTIAGQTFTWAQGISLGRAFVKGQDLFLKYQEIYDLGVIVCDGIIVLPNGVIVCDTTVMSSGVIVADQIQTSAGGVLGSGTFFISVNSLTSGTLVLPGGVIVCDGVIVADVNYINTLLTLSANAQIYGDSTAQMPVILSDR
jgi:serine protease AprX